MKSMFSRAPVLPKFNAVMVGLDAAGKTTIVNKLKLGEVKTTMLGFEFKIESVSLNGTSITVWDVRGSDHIRMLWPHYYNEKNVIIYVVNSNDLRRRWDDGTNRRMETSEEFMKIVTAIPNVPILVYANKQDLRDSNPVAEVADLLGLKDLPPSRVWRIQASCAVTGEGLWEGLEWLRTALDQ